MSKAAYDRGSRAIATQLRQNDRPIEFEIIDNMNRIPKNETAMAPFGEVEILSANGVFWIECPIKRRGFWYRKMSHLMASWRVIITGYDATTQRFTAVPMPQ